MGELARIGDLDVSEDMRYQRLAWRVQTIGAIVMAALIVAALLGLFHDGPLSDAEAGGEQAGVEVEYERFLRAEAPAHLNLDVLEGEGTTQLALSADYLDNFEVTDIQPTPDSVRAQPDRFVYTFEQSPPSRVTFRLEPKTLGVHDATIWGPGEREVELTQIVYP